MYADPSGLSRKIVASNFRLRASAGIPTNASTHPRPDPRSLGRREGLACSTAQAGTVPYMPMADLGAEVIEIEVPDGGDMPRSNSVLPGMPMPDARDRRVAGRPYAGIALMMAARNCRSPTGLNSTVVG